MRQLVVCFLFIFTICTLNVNPVVAEDATEDFLPIGLTDEEMTRLNEIGINHTVTAPPPGEIRNCAEWEPSEGVIIRWPLGISYSLIAEFSEDVMVTTIVGSASQRSSAISAYTSNGVNMANTSFIIAPTNSIWTRDYGPWFVFDGSGDLNIVDHMYNRPRPDDDQIPWVIGSEWGMNVYGMSLEHAGGNHMSDGLGTSMSTWLVYDENPGLSHGEVDSIMMAYVGNDYDVLEYIEYGGIHHIDCWAKFLSPTTILIKDVPTGHSSYALLNARAEYLSQQISAWGQPYTIVRVYCPYGTAYTNSLILNGKVYVPTFGSSYDDDALLTYENAMPGYEVLGFDGSWYDNDAIHCRAMGVPDRGMLEIHHIPLTTTGDTLNDYLVSVKIVPHSGSALISDSLKIFYQTKSQFQPAPLYATAVPDSFYGYIPAQNAGSVVRYYIQAGDYSERVETHPYIGQSWAHQFSVNSPPAITSPDSIICHALEDFAYYPEFSDPDDTALTIAYSDYPGWMTVQNDTLIGTAPDNSVTESFTVSVSDPYYSTEQAVTVTVYVCGDANGDSEVNVADAVYVINYVFKGGPAPAPEISGDSNNDGDVNIADGVFVINYVFKGGHPPECP
jgi:agmatine/peptidylarginine deiminase